MSKKRLYHIGGYCLFGLFGLFIIISNIGNILKEQKSKKFRNTSEITNVINRINSEVPYQVEAERWFTGAELVEDTLTCKYELRCNKETEEFYFQHKKDMRKLSLLSFKMMDGQNNKYGSKIATILKSNHLVLKYSTKMPSLRRITYIYSAEEIEKTTMDSLIDKKAIMLYLNMIIHIKSLSLPIITTENGEPIKVAINDKTTPLKYLILNKIKLQGKNVIFYYCTPEINYPISVAQKGCKNEADIRYILNELCKDPYFKGLINYFAMAKCNMILRYKGAKSLQSMDINFPYRLLREHSYIPKDLLDQK